MGRSAATFADTGWAWAAEVASRLFGVGWAWAALAIAAGWLAGAGARGVLAGAIALLAATTAYYGMDSVLRNEPLAWYWYGMLRWWLASVVLGPVLGVVGASIRRPGVIGLLAGLALPVGATAQNIRLPGDPMIVTSAMTSARVIVWAAAALGASALIVRFIAAKTGHASTGRPPNQL